MRLGRWRFDPPSGVSRARGSWHLGRDGDGEPLATVAYSDEHDGFYVYASVGRHVVNTLSAPSLSPRTWAMLDHAKAWARSWVSARLQEDARHG